LFRTDLDDTVGDQTRTQEDDDDYRNFEDSGSSKDDRSGDTYD
jgi:hypothetical protein